MLVNCCLWGVGAAVAGVAVGAVVFVVAAVVVVVLVSFSFVGCWVAECRSLVVCCSLLVVGCWCWLLVFVLVVGW